MRGAVRRGILCVLLLGPAVPAAAQEVATAVSQDTIRVGDIIRAQIRLDLPPGHRAVFPDTLSLGEEVEQAGRREETVEELAGGGRRVTASYPLTAWRPGPVSLPAVTIRVDAPDGVRTVEAALPELTVRSVLPPDSPGAEPRPLKDVLGASRSLWPWLIALVGGLGAAGGLLYWYRRRAGRIVAPLAAPLSPRERALIALDRARDLRLIEAGELKTFYSLVTAAVRLYLNALNPEWGAELTTSELIERIAPAVPPEAAAGLDRLLRSADLVKFAKRRPAPAEAAADWAAAREWVLGFRWPVQDRASGVGAGSDGGSREEVA